MYNPLDNFDDILDLKCIRFDAELDEKDQLRTRQAKLVSDYDIECEEDLFKTAERETAEDIEWESTVNDADEYDALRKVGLTHEQAEDVIHG